MSDYSYLFKFIIIGDSSVGKSCVLLQFLDRKFKLEHDTTIGVEFGSKTIQVSGRNVKLQIWDTAGQESFKSITRSYYRGSICALVIYDVTQRDSFENTMKWIEETKHYGNENTYILLVGNKNDLRDQRMVSTQEGENLANKHGLQFYETSAKTGYNIEQVRLQQKQKMFRKSTEVVIQRIDCKQIDASNESIGIRIGNQLIKDVQPLQEQQQKKDNCC